MHGNLCKMTLTAMIKALGETPRLLEWCCDLQHLMDVTGFGGESLITAEVMVV